ncbi:PREDICTED: UDP-glucuronosyltransferase 2A3-like [Nicrophorus vespilloides]|uniref:UDP-glucuronosyltransferase n=1 Tax=Nicrophorus vespilloides TaxID=110193 RepID=A0ABM1NIW2_NICVS|nr:PREDICTED: UDP-glucuronosyltransferase 2A3-like [Nicrophorus vespilloides]
MLFLLFSAFVVADGAKILGFFSLPCYSHQVTFNSLSRELSLRGHQLTVITPNPINDPTLSNLTEIDLHDASYRVFDKYNISRLSIMDEKDGNRMDIFMELSYDLIRAQLSHPRVAEIIRNDAGEEFDLCLIEYIIPGPYPLIDVYKCPMIAVSSMPTMIYGHETIGNPNHPSVFPDINLPMPSILNLFQRVQSFLFWVSNRLSMNDIDFKFDSLLREFYNQSTRSVSELKLDIDLVIANANPILNVPRPTVPNYIKLAGLHLHPPKPLPTDILELLDQSPGPVIYMSFGSTIKSDLLPSRTIRMLLDVFAELPHKILWKFESDNLPARPDNVQIRPWFPQQDLLGHPKVKLFITQGGIQSLDEALFSGTPVVVIPFCGDQFSNALRVEDVGLGRSIPFAELTKDNLKSTILQALNETYPHYLFYAVESTRYSRRAKELSRLVQDRPMTALEEAVWWVEFVLRHKGADHLKSPLRRMPWYQFFCLDVVAVLVAPPILLIVLIKMLLMMRRRRLSTKHKKD